MRCARFEWDEENLEHIARHGIDQDEAEAVLDGNPLILRTADNKYLAYGPTDEGRYLLVVFIRKPGPIIRVVTARDMKDGEKKRYEGGVNNMPKIPTFATEREAAEWFATHNTAPYMDELEEVTEKIHVIRSRPTKKSIGLRLRSDYLTAIKQVAERKGIPYQTLIQMWLVERLRQEAPDLLHP